MESFNPNDPGNLNNTIFGLPYRVEDAHLVFIPVPWDVTVSYKDGTAGAPEAIFKASFQIDLLDPFKEKAWETSMAMDKINESI